MEVISTWFWEFGRRLEFLETPSNSEPNVQAPSILLNQPLDLLWELSDHMPVASAAALSLTCKAAYNALFPRLRRKLSGPVREDFLLLLEKDVNHSFFYCHTCARLRRPRSSWRLLRIPPGCHKDHYDISNTDHVLRFRLLRIQFHHVHLAMNEHFFGLGRGLPLRALEIEILPFRFTGGWGLKSEAKVVQDELVLAATHTLFLRGMPPDVRRDLDYHHNQRICHHTVINSSPFCSWDPSIRQYRKLSRPLDVEPRDEEDSMGSDIEVCQEATGFCSECLTDYTMKIERQENQWQNGRKRELWWFITIISYHQLGDCRLPSDWKWQTFSKKHSSSLVRREQFLRSLHAPGSVERLWNSDSDN
jgi:hypothetical protein